ncbi:hypothetical protein F5Y06DRAFT_296893 [Hypoxylon sp. FL0890]|nr:hypothetical protein F5Y06DRAFT_296893 [Hypoxylon sp. FL0890]
MAKGTFEKPIRPVATKNVAIRPVRSETQGPMKILRRFKELTRRELWTKADPDHHVDWTDDRVWEKITREGYYHRADEMLVSCGTVTLDQANSSQPMVLMVYNKNIGIYQLPKGRKNFDEGYLDTALRETCEETGVAVKPLRLRFGSRSTPPKLDQVQTQARETRYGVEDKLTGITEGLSNESIGAKYQFVLDPDPATGAWRHIYWFAAQTLGDTRRDESKMTEEEDRKKFTTFWFSETDALSRLKLEDEKFSEYLWSNFTPYRWISNLLEAAMLYPIDRYVRGDVIESQAFVL